MTIFSRIFKKRKTPKLVHAPQESAPVSILNNTIVNTASQMRDITQQQKEEERRTEFLLLDSHYRYVIECIENSAKRGEFYAEPSMQISSVLKERLEREGFTVKSSWPTGYYIIYWN